MEPRPGLPLGPSPIGLPGPPTENGRPLNEGPVVVPVVIPVGGGGGGGNTPTMIAGINGEPPRPLTSEDVAAITEAGSKGGTFMCTLCNKKFGYKNGLIRHVRLTHVGEKPYQCNICNRRFGYKHILMEHQNLHFGNRPYACTMCDKKFAARSNLIQHRMVHKRPFNCNMCNKRFDREDQLKKHLFAHPQALLTCNFCQYAAASQADLNKHMVEHHPPQVLDTRTASRRSSDEKGQDLQPAEEIDEHPGTPQTPHTPLTPQPAPLVLQQQVHPDQPGQQPLPNLQLQTHQPSPPQPLQQLQQQHAGSEDGSDRGTPVSTHAPSTPTTPLHSPLGPYAIPQYLQHRGQRVESICNQLITSVTSTDHGQYQGVIVKKEAEEMSDTTCSMGVNIGNGIPMGHVSPHDLSAQQVYSTIESLRTPSSLVYNSVLSGSVPSSLQNALANSGLATSLPGLMTTRECTPGTPMPTLPAIHEVFSRRPQRIPPTFTSFGVPTILSPDNRLGVGHPELSISLRSPPPTSFQQTSPTLPMTNSVRPTPQLPPIAQVFRQTKDSAVQHSAPIPGFPALDDVLSYYMNQGKLFKCQHCNILFFERGMYFLHASLHGTSSPWECSICHKVCSDKNEFTLHFVNQQHNS